MTETLRGLLLGSPIGSSAAIALAWCAAIAGYGYLVARRAYNHRPARQEITSRSAGERRPPGG